MKPLLVEMYESLKNVPADIDAGVRELYSLLRSAPRKKSMMPDDALIIIDKKYGNKKADAIEREFKKKYGVDVYAYAAYGEQSSVSETYQSSLKMLEKVSEDEVREYVISLLDKPCIINQTHRVTGRDTPELKKLIAQKYRGLQNQKVFVTTITKWGLKSDWGWREDRKDQMGAWIVYKP